MYLGYKDNVISLVANTKEELENTPLIKFTKIVQTFDPVEKVNGVFYVGQDNIDIAKKEIVRQYRNHLLETEIDPVVSNPLRWADMTEEEQNDYKNYRLYLLDYTNQPSWWNQNPLTFKEWKKQQ